MFSETDVIYRYTRADALNDGVLVDVSDFAREAGFAIPVAITRAVYESYIVPSNSLHSDGQSTEGRLWDTLSVLWFTAKRGGGSTIMFSVLFLMDSSMEPEQIELKAMCHPGDTHEPVVTILLPNED
jgi:hypothetical protein